jgi:hypothetical protein
MVVVCEISDCVYDPKVPKACMTILSNQDIALDISGVRWDNAHFSIHLPERCNHGKYLTHEDA